MTKEQAVKLASKLDAQVNESIIVDVEDNEIVFTSEYTGRHSLKFECSSTARVKSHWKGFLISQPAHCIL